jgi:hypothetical protein
MSNKQTYYSESQLPVEDLKAVGLSMEYLKEKKPEILNALLNGEKTQVLNVKLNTGSIELTSQAKLQLQGRPNDSTLKLAVHGVRLMPEIRNSYGDYALTEADKNNLLEHQNMFKLIEVKEGNKVLIGLDPETKQFVSIKPEQIFIPDSLAGITITPEDKEKLKSGQPVLKTGMTGKDGNFDANLILSAGKRSIAFLNKDAKLHQDPKQEQKQGNTEKKKSVKRKL